MYSQDSADQAPAIFSSRVGMVVAVYDAAIEAVEEVANILREGHESDATLAKSQALVRLGLIESGLDLRSGTIPLRIKELCGFVERSVLTSNIDDIAASTSILKNLRDGFVGISEQATAMEASGEIPKLPTQLIDTLA